MCDGPTAKDGRNPPNVDLFFQKMAIFDHFACVFPLNMMGQEFFFSSKNPAKQAEPFGISLLGRARTHPLVVTPWWLAPIFRYSDTQTLPGCGTPPSSSLLGSGDECLAKHRLWPCPEGLRGLPYARPASNPPLDKGDGEGSPRMEHPPNTRPQCVTCVTYM